MGGNCGAGILCAGFCRLEACAITPKNRPNRQNPILYRRPKPIGALDINRIFAQTDIIMKRKYIIVAVLTPLMLLLDQFTKWLVVRHMTLGQTKPIIPEFLSWHYLVNPGAAFGLFRNLPEKFRAPFFLTISAVAILVVVYYLVISDDDKVIFPVCIAFVISGALGNLIDRIRLDYVVDFVLVEATFLGQGAVDILNKWFGTHQWPSFNVADSLIVVGIIGMAIDLIFFMPAEEENQKSEAADRETDTQEDGHLELSSTIADQSENED